MLQQSFDEDSFKGGLEPSMDRISARKQPRIKAGHTESEVNHFG